MNGVPPTEGQPEETILPALNAYVARAHGITQELELLVEDLKAILAERERPA